MINQLIKEYNVKLWIAYKKEDMKVGVELLGRWSPGHKNN